MNEGTIAQLIVGTLLSVVLTFLSSRIGKILDCQLEFKAELSSLRKDVDINTTSIRKLDSERDRRQNDELDELREVIKELKREQAHES